MFKRSPHLCASFAVCDGFLRFSSSVMPTDLLMAILPVESLLLTHLLKYNLTYNRILDYQLIPNKVQLNLKFRSDFKQRLLLSFVQTKASQGNKTIPASCSFETCTPDKICAMKARHICDQIMINKLTCINEHKGQARSTCTNNLNKSRCKLIVCFW